jgi:putative ABC transport system substrate-binding protein
MDRRAFVAILTCGLLAAPGIAIAQQAKTIRRIGVLSGGTASNAAAPLSASLREYGWIEGQNLIIDARGTGGKGVLAPALAAELVQLNVEVIVTFGAVGSLAAKNATTTIPIVANSGTRVVSAWSRACPDPAGTSPALA